MKELHLGLGCSVADAVSLLQNWKVNNEEVAFVNFNTHKLYSELD